MSDTPMNDVRDLLPEYLGGELDEQTRLRFEQHLAQDAALAEEVASLQAAQRSLESLPAPPEVAGRVGLGRGVNLSIMRYAAAVAIAFALGYLLRGAGPGPSPDGGDGTTVVEDAPHQPRTPDPASSDDWRPRFASSYTEHTGNDFSRSLLALRTLALEE